MDDSEPVSQAIVTAVAAVTGESPNPDAIEADGTLTPTLAPLYDVVDPDALEQLFRSIDRRRQGEARITFDYAGCEVTVRSDHRVSVRKRGELT